MAAIEYTPRTIIKMALRDINAIGIGETPDGDEEAQALDILNQMLDWWQSQPGLAYVVTRSVYSLTANVQTYTLGDGATFSQVRPTRIMAWSVIPDDDATDVQEIPQGPPYTWQQWQHISQKSLTGKYPSAMWADWDHTTADGYMNVSFYPVPDNSDVDVVLYCRGHVAPVTASTIATSTAYAPGYARAMRLNLAMELCDPWGRTPTTRLEQNAEVALNWVKAMNTRPTTMAARSEFLGHLQRRGQWVSGQQVVSGEGL
jgi:hypothetical protein